MTEEAVETVYGHDARYWHERIKARNADLQEQGQRLREAEERAEKAEAVIPEWHALWKERDTRIAQLEAENERLRVENVKLLRLVTQPSGKEAKT